MNSEISRRPLKSREAKWPRVLAARLVTHGLTPNQISIASVALSAIGAACLLGAAHRLGTTEAVLFIAAAICIQLRLVCNLLDGLIAVEGGLKTKSGEIFNEFPDRVADVLLFIAAGYSVQLECAAAVEMGYLCAIVSVMVAYVRVFGGSAGFPQDFCGPMAKQQRMAALTIASLLSAAEAFARWDHRVMLLALVLIFVGSLITAARRTLRIRKLLEMRCDVPHLHSCLRLLAHSHSKRDRRGHRAVPRTNGEDSVGTNGLRLFRELRACAAHVAHPRLRKTKREAALLLRLRGAVKRRLAVRRRQTSWSSADRAERQPQ